MRRPWPIDRSSRSSHLSTGTDRLVACGVVCLAGLLAGLAGCQAETLPATFDRPVVLGGKLVAARNLQRGAAIYTQACRACHGAEGGGNGTAALGLRPPPRDLRLGVYKFGAVASGQLPTDDDFRRIIVKGLHGTAMLPWDLPSPQLDDVIDYIKTFSERWQTEGAGQPITLSADPWAADGRIGEGIERGKRVYHGLAQCAVACHPAYVTRADIFAFTQELTRMRISGFRSDLYSPVAKVSDYGYAILPPDFTFNVLRSGDTAADIYRVVASGIGGTAMPTWKNVLADSDLWAIAHYVKSLAALRDTPLATTLREQLRTQPAWTPPPPPAPAGAVSGGGR
jgi:mono/diheme cytochrome c family protein